MVVMIATPCLAQEIETDGIFSIEGTLWRMDEIQFATIPPFVQRSTTDSIGFHQEVVYFCDEYRGCRPSDTFTVIESPLGTIGMIVSLSAWSVFIETHIYLRNGFGVVIGFGSMMHAGIPVLISHIGTVFKIEDNWTPPGVE
jgi:hypothetical protein